VAKDPGRPFKVRTGPAEIVATGTSFDVASLPERTLVTLIEGRVGVLTIPGTPAVPTRVEVLVLGQQLRIVRDTQLAKSPVKVENRFASGMSRPRPSP
jgi:ferric-dicitrate binding protein FerR (iron transport regulator)